MGSKLENLLSFNDFKNNWKSETSTKSKRTETGLDILKESIEYFTLEEKIQKVKDLISEHDSDSDIIEDVVNELRDAFVRMEKNEEISENEIDELDEKHDGEWKSWILEVIEIVPDYAIDSVLSVLGEDITVEKELDEIDDFEELDDETDCPDCEGTGLYDDGSECERCEGKGVIFRPDDIPPMSY